MRGSLELAENDGVNYKNWAHHQSNSNARRTSKLPTSYSRGVVLFMVAKVRMDGGCCVLLPGENITEVVPI